MTEWAKQKPADWRSAMIDVGELLGAALPGVVIARTRFQNAADASGPAVLIRCDDAGWQETLDPGRGRAQTFALECRSPTAEGVDAIAVDALDALRPHLSAIIEDSDRPADYSSLHGEYFLRLLEVRLSLAGTVRAPAPEPAPEPAPRRAYSPAYSADYG